MTLHAAKGLEFEVVFLPGWEEGLFPHQRSLDESGNAGLEEERRLAYVGLTRARRQAKVSFAQNRRNRGLYQSAAPSRFVDELPEPQRRGDRGQEPLSAARRAAAWVGAGGSTPTAAAASTSPPPLRQRLFHARLATRQGAHERARTDRARGAR